MNGITRRDVLRTSGFALGVPLVGAVLPKSFSQSGTSGVSQSGSGSGLGRKTLNPDLQAYVVRDVPRLTAKARAGSLDASDYQSLSSSFHLFARHLQGAGTEPLRASIVASLNTSSAVDLSQLDEAHDLFSKLTKHDPGLSHDKFRKSLTFQPHHLEKGRQSLVANTIPWHLHTMADALKTVGSSQISVGPSQTSFSPELHFNTERLSEVLVDGVYHPGSAAHLEQVKFCGLTGKQWCVVAATLVALGLGIAAILAAGPASAAAATAAAALGISTTALIAILEVATLISAAIANLCGVFI